MNWLRYQPQTVADYPYDNAEGGRKHMFVIKVPYKYYYAYDRFIEGKYSEMYTSREIASLFANSSNEDALEVINKTASARAKFIEKIHKSFVVPYDKIELSYSAELDFPLQNNKEMFNHEFVVINNEEV